MPSWFELEGESLPNIANKCSVNTSKSVDMYDLIKNATIRAIKLGINVFNEATNSTDEMGINGLGINIEEVMEKNVAKFDMNFTCLYNTDRLSNISYLLNHSSSLTMSV